MYYKKNKLAKLIFLLFFFQNSYAEPLVIQINYEDTDATRVEKNILDIPGSITNINKNKLQLGTEQLGLDESLNHVPGTFFQNRYNFAQDLRVSIRGFGSRSNFGIRGIKIIVDGIPETLADGQGSVDGIDIGSINKINVIRGPTSSLYGNASGGAIVIETEKGSKEPFMQLKNSYGAHNLGKEQFKIGGISNNLNYLFNFSNTTIDGYRDNSDFKNEQFSSRVEYQISDYSSILSTIHYTKQPFANDPGGISKEDVALNRKQSRTNNLNYKAGEKLKQIRFGLIYKNIINKNNSIELKSYSINRDFDNKLPFESGGIVDLKRNFYGGGLKFTRNNSFVTNKNRFLIGIDYDRQEDDRKRYNNLSGERGSMSFQQDEFVTSLGIYFQNETKLNDFFEITLGARYDDIKFDVSDKFLSNGDDSGKVNFDQWSPMLGLSFKLYKSTNLYANISKAFETPTTTEFTSTSGGGFDPKVKPQKSVNYELGFKTSTNKHLFEAAVFHIDVDDELTSYELSGYPGRSFYKNAGSSERNGFELSSSGKLTNNIEYQFSYTYSDFKFNHFTNKSGTYDGNYIPGIPKYLLNIFFLWKNNLGLYASLDNLFSGSLYADNANENKVSSHMVSNLRFGKNINYKDYKIRLYSGINNIFDKRYFSNIRINAFGGNYYEPAPKQNFYFGLTIDKNF